MEEFTEQTSELLEPRADIGEVIEEIMEIFEEYGLNDQEIAAVIVKLCAERELHPTNSSSILKAMSQRMKIESFRESLMDQHRIKALVNKYGQLA